MRRSTRLRKSGRKPEKDDTPNKISGTLKSTDSASDPKDLLPPLWRLSFTNLQTADIKFPVPQVQSESQAAPHNACERFNSTGITHWHNRFNMVLTFKEHLVSILVLLKRYETRKEFPFLIPGLFFFSSASDAAVGFLVLYTLFLLFLTLWKDVEWERARESYSE
jgi:hypothetical protein